jgi:hypothetical protein
MMLPRVIFALLLASGTLLSAPENTVIHDPAAAQALEGDHRFSLQWISWENFGSVTITNEDGRGLLMAGRQSRST